ncbi:MAG TPA: aminotransferase class V-fold PLP-dependent enzyme [Synergistales bacterium]|nr:aminotransferase class V-fold PLP-dependent enzyme [Synergistales bacterium]
MKKEKGKISAIMREQALDKGLLEKAGRCAQDYLDSVLGRPVFPEEKDLEGLEEFRHDLPEEPGDPGEILDRLHRFGSPGTVAQVGGRYFGFVNGGVVPASLAVKRLIDAWDQNAALYAMSPVVSVLEEVCEGWLVDLFGLPEGSAAGFIGGSATANLCGIAAGRDHLLAQCGWEASSKGLFGAPELKVVVGDGAHATVFKALSILGLGRERLVRVPTDGQGRLRPDGLPALDERTLLILQAGNVSSGAFDPFAEICPRAREAGAWVHIDGAFGLWAAASPRLRHLTAGMELADSWSVDAHKTLNAPYDSGIVLCRRREALTGALQVSGSYIAPSGHRDGMHYTLDMSRRARAVELWACLAAMGQRGVAELVEDLHDKAVLFAHALAREGFHILNEVCFNQVLVSCGDPRLTEKTLALVQGSGECWCGSAQWDGEFVMRVSVCSYRTTAEDIERSVRAFVRAREEARL